MKNNVIELYQYRDIEPFDFAAYNRRAEIRFRNSQIRFWLSTAADIMATVVSGCRCVSRWASCRSSTESATTPPGIPNWRSF